MATGPLPHSIFIHGTYTTDGAQSFAGLNLGTINYARSDNNPSRVHWLPLALFTVANTAIWQMRTNKRPSSAETPSSSPIPTSTARA